MWLTLVILGLLYPREEKVLIADVNNISKGVSWNRIEKHINKF